MGDRVDINGVNTWYAERGVGDTIVLLHGGLTDSRDFAGNLDTSAGRFRCLLPERRGHGHTADVDGPITADVMAKDTIGFLERIVGRPVPLVGYSAGAMVALWVAARRPDLVSKLVVISGGFDRSGIILRPVAGVPMPPSLVAAYGEVSPDGADHFAVIVAKIARSAAEEPGLTRGARQRELPGACHGCGRRHRDTGAHAGAFPRTAEGRARHHPEDVTPSSARETGAMRQTGPRFLQRPSRSYADANPPQCAFESWRGALGCVRQLMQWELVMRVQRRLLLTAPVATWTAWCVEN
jgi:pimeloyl-ACP methyl ester carboxylesterase